MAIYRLTYTENSRLEQKFFDTKEEAEEAWKEKCALELLDTVPHKGSRQTRAQALVSGLDQYYLNLDKAEVQEFVPAK